MVPMTRPVLATLIDCMFEGRMVTISAAHMGRATSPRESIGWPNAVICLPSTRETVPVPARVMSPVASATATAAPGRNVAMPAEEGWGASVAATLLPPREKVPNPTAAKFGASRSATTGLRPPSVKTGCMAL